MLLLIPFMLTFYLNSIFCDISVRRPVFPIELGHNIELDVKNLLPDTIVRVYINQNSICTVEYKLGCISKNAICERKSDEYYKIKFKPKREDHNQKLRVVWLKGQKALISNDETLYWEQKILLTHTPTDLKIKFNRLNDPFKVVPEPETTFNSGDKFEVMCTSSGSLPPRKIEIALSCQPRNLALAEATRLDLARANIAIELWIPDYDYSVKTNPEKFTRLIATYDEKKEIDKTNKQETNTASKVIFVANKRLDSCSVVCSQETAQVSSSPIVVMYNTEHAFILPRPENGFIRAGDTVSCHADGNPYPNIKLEGFSPKTKPAPLTKELEMILEQRKSLPQEMGSRGLIILENGSTQFYNETSPTSIIGILRYKQNLKYMPIIKPINDDFDIHGSHMTISENATIGNEIIVICYAGNLEVHSRFIITYRYNASLGVVLGICAGMLLLSFVVLTLMVIMKKRQRQTQEAFNARTKPGNGYQAENPAAQKGYDYYPVKNNTMQRDLHSPNHGRYLEDVKENPYESGSQQQQNEEEVLDQISTFTRNTNHNQKRSNQNSQLLVDDFDNEDHVEHYATLDFTTTQNEPPVRPNQSQNRTPIHTAGIRSNSLIGGPQAQSSKRKILSRSAGTSSTTLFGAVHNMPPRSVVGGSGGQIMNQTRNQMADSNPDDVDITEVIACLRPKEASTNYVEAQRFEAISSILDMNRKKDSEIV